MVKSKEYTIIPDIYEAAKGSEILLLLTDHKMYKNIDLKKLKEVMAANPVIVDTREIIDREAATKEKFEYSGLGGF